MKNFFFKIAGILHRVSFGLGFIIRKKNSIIVVKKFLKELFNIFYTFFKIRRLPKEIFINNLVDFAYQTCEGFIKPLQNRFEVRKLLEKVKEVKPRFILEIGTAKGGTLFFFTRLAHKTAIIISVDLPGGVMGGGYSTWKIPLYKSFTSPHQSIHLLREDSHNINTLKTIKSILKGNKLDFLFIDGDHTYEGVKKDFKMYKTLVRKNGLITFHDINSETMGVFRFWREIKKRYKCEEIVRDRDFKEEGIGILTNDDY